MNPGRTYGAAVEKALTWENLGRVELRRLELRTSCMPCKMRKFNCRQMPARDGSCHSSRIGHAQNDGQNDLEKRLITPIPVARGSAIWQSSRQPASRADACTDGENPGGTNVVRFAPNAESVLVAHGSQARQSGAHIDHFCALAGITRRRPDQFGGGEL